MRLRKKPRLTPNVGFESLRSNSDGRASNATAANADAANKETAANADAVVNETAANADTANKEPRLIKKPAKAIRLIEKLSLRLGLQ